MELGKAEEAALPALLDSVPYTVSSVVPTVTSETVSEFTTVTELDNIIYAIPKQDQVPTTKANAAQKPPTGKGDNFIQISESMAKSKQTLKCSKKAMEKVVVMADEAVVPIKVVLAPVMVRVMTVEVW